MGAITWRLVEQRGSIDPDNCEGAFVAHGSPGNHLLLVHDPKISVTNVFWIQEWDSSEDGSNDADSSGIQVEEVIQTARQLSRQVCDCFFCTIWRMLSPQNSHCQH